MFRREDYWPFMFGVFVLGGLVAVPLIWSLFVDLPFKGLVASSLVGCFVFAYAHTRDGQFSVRRFIVGFGLALLITLRVTARSGGIGAFIPGGVLGILVMEGCGWLAIGIARVTGVPNERFWVGFWRTMSILSGVIALWLIYDGTINHRGSEMTQHRIFALAFAPLWCAWAALAWSSSSLLDERLQRAT